MLIYPVQSIGYKGEGAHNSAVRGTVHWCWPLCPLFVRQADGLVQGLVLVLVLVLVLDQGLPSWMGQVLFFRWGQAPYVFARARAQTLPNRAPQKLSRY